MFVPTVFITGISGAFYRQFALTIAGATVISLIVSLTLGTAVFAGMIGVTAFGLIFTPVFYVICRWLAGVARRPAVPASAVLSPGE